MRLHARHALLAAVIGVLAFLAGPAHGTGSTSPVADRQHAPQLTAVTIASTEAAAPAPRLRPLNLSLIGVSLATALSIAFAICATRRTSPYRRPSVRALGYGRRRGPPFALA